MYQKKNNQLNQEISKALTYFPKAWWGDERWRDNLKHYWKEESNTSDDCSESFSEFDPYEGLDEDERSIMREIDSHRDSSCVIEEEEEEEEVSTASAVGSSEVKEMRKKLAELYEKEKKLFQIAIDEAKGKASQEDIVLAESLNEEIQKTIDDGSKHLGNLIRADMARVSYEIFKANADKDGLLEGCIYGYVYDRDIDNWMEATVWDYSGHADNVASDDYHEDSYEQDCLVIESSKLARMLADDKCDCIEAIKKLVEFTKAFDKLEEADRMRFLAKMLHKQGKLEYKSEKKEWYPSPKEISEVFVNEKSPKKPEVSTSFVFDEDELPF